MKFKYLGTAAAEGIPAIFCECEVCKKSRKLGGKSIRTRSQAIIDGKLLIDFPADTYMHVLQYGISLADIESCIVTHSHADHLYTAELEYRKDGFGHIYSDKVITFYSDKASYESVQNKIDSARIPESKIKNTLITPFVPFTASGYKITALRASHAASTSPVVYLIEKDGKALLYSHDSSEYPEESMEFLKAWGGHIDFVSADCTEGTREISYVGHLNLQRNIAMREQLDALGVTDKNTVWVLNHFSHNGGLSGGTVVYDEFKDIAAEHGFGTSYDGLEINI